MSYSKILFIYFKPANCVWNNRQFYQLEEEQLQSRTPSVGTPIDHDILSLNSVTISKFILAELVIKKA